MPPTSVVDCRSHQMRDSRIERDGVEVGVAAGEPPPGSAGMHLAAGLPPLRPAERVFEAMLDGWRNQQLVRRLAFSTVEGRERAVRAFAAYADAFPWEWPPGLVDDWMTDLRAVRRLRRSMLGGYQVAVRLFCGYVTDPAYGGALTSCLLLGYGSGVSPVQRDGGSYEHGGGVRAEHRETGPRG